MKIILNKDVYPLGEEGDVKDVAKGYARNFLFPRKLAYAYSDSVVKMFEARRAEIEERKAVKRKDSTFLKEKIENLEMVIEMPAGANGKLYGAVTNQTIVDELQKADLKFERKKIEIPGNSIKSVGKYRIIVKLYESISAELKLSVQAQGLKKEKPVVASGKSIQAKAKPSVDESVPVVEKTENANISVKEESQVEAVSAEAETINEKNDLTTDKASENQISE